MSANAFSGGLGLGLAVFLAATAVKLLDDLLDEPEGPGWLRAAGNSPPGAGGPAIYAALALALAAGLAWVPAVTLFLAAYALGMLPRPRERLPSGLPSWAESVIATGLGVLLGGPAEMAGSLLLVAAVQAADDAVDLTADRAAGRVGSVARAIGRWPAATLAAVLFAAAAWLSPAKALAGLGPVVAFVVPPVSGRKPGPGRLLAGAVVATLLGGTGGAVIPTALGAGPGGHAPGVGGDPWVLLALTLAVSLAIVGGVGWAYRRGLDGARRRAGPVAAALLPLVRRADLLDGAGPPGAGAPGAAGGAVWLGDGPGHTSPGGAARRAPGTGRP